MQIRMQKMRDRLEKGLTAALTGVRLNGHRELRLPNTCSLSFRDLEANRLLEEIGLYVAASAGAACQSALLPEASYVHFYSDLGQASDHQQ
jgi:cysteine desulfurase